MPCHTLYNLSSRPRWHPPCLVNMVLFRFLTKLLFRQPQLFVWPDVRFHASTIVFFPQSQTHTQRILVLFGSRTTEGSIATNNPYRCPEISFRLGILFTPLFAVPADGLFRPFRLIQEAHNLECAKVYRTAQEYYFFGGFYYPGFPRRAGPSYDSFPPARFVHIRKGLFGGNQFVPLLG